MSIRAASVLAGLLTLTFVLSACGGASTSAQRPGTVKVFSCTTVSMPDCKANAKRADEQAVGRALRQSPNVVKVVYVSKAAALIRFQRNNPAFVKHLPENPLPDQWVVTVDSDQNEATVGKAICAARYPGVERCATAGQLGEVGGVVWGSPLADRIRHLR